MDSPKQIYRKVAPTIWDDEKFLSLDDDAQSIWLLLLTGPQTCAIPGLQLADVYTLASARRWPVERVQRCLGALGAAGMVEVDERLRVIRLPNAPKHNPPDNPSVLRGWWKEYDRLPKSDLKRHHVASIKAAVDFARYPGTAGKDPWKCDFAFAWGATFGSVENDDAEAASRHPVEQGVPTPCATSVSSDQGAVNSSSEQQRPAGADATAGPRRGSRSESSKGRQKDANAVVDALLGELSDARIRLRPSCRPMTPSAAARKHIAARLEEGHAPDDVRHVIAVCEAECRRYRGPEDKDPFQWFDAISPFRAENFERKLARQAPAATVTPIHGERRSTFKPRPDEIYGADFIDQLIRQTEAEDAGGTSKTDDRTKALA